MQSAVRRKLAMAMRVWDFFQANPSDEPGHREVLARMGELISRADALAVQQRGGAAEELAAVRRRSELRRKMEDELLPHLVEVGREVATERSDLAGKFRIPSRNLTLRAFRDITRGMLDLATPERDLFVAKGLSKDLLDDLSTTFGEFEKATVASHEGRRFHVGASADLGLVTAEIVKLVNKLHQLNRYRLRQNGELMAAWKSARVVVGPFGPGPVKAEPEDGEAPPSASAAPAA